jgi:hypothetical protein
MVMKKLIRDGDAVSETLGYIIIFGIVFMCIGILLVSGNQIISNAEEQTMFQGIEQSFNVLSSDLRKTSFDASPMRTLQIRLDGSMEFSPNDFDLVVTGSDDTYIIYPGGPFGSIRFQSARTSKSISLENDAVIKDFSDLGADTSIMSQQPRMYVSDDSHTLMVSVIYLEGIESGVGGQGVADIKMSYDSITTYSDAPPGGIVKIKVLTDNKNAWKNYFLEQFKDYSPAVSFPGGYVELSLQGISKVEVVEYKINVAMS